MPRTMPFVTDLFLRYPASVASRARGAWFRLLGVRFAGRIDLRRISIPRNPWDISLGACALDDGVVLLTTGGRRDEAQGGPRIVIGSGVYINRWTMLDASEKIEIADGVMIGPHCYITDHDHGTAQAGSVGAQPLVSAPTRVCKNAWLGAHVSVLKGVTIGEGAVVGAGAVVTRDVPAGAIAAGVPAKVVGWRGKEASHV
jgi:acetyltransferase-like isoleucine patch superfamily enzyme